MPTPTILVLGVYRPVIPKSIYNEQLAVTGSHERTREHFERLVLIEVVVEHCDDRFKMIDLRQHGTTEKYDQVAYDEALLSGDGKCVIERDMNCVKGSGLNRFAFYLHFYDPARPLLWSFGEVDCPPVEPTPSRLTTLVPDRACT